MIIYPPGIPQNASCDDSLLVQETAPIHIDGASMQKGALLGMQHVHLILIPQLLTGGVIDS